MTEQEGHHLTSELATSLGLPNATFEVVEGGFTPVSKYIVQNQDDSFFIKVVDIHAYPLESAIVGHEAKMYELLQKAGVVGSVLPHYRGTFTDGTLQILKLDALQDVTWGGPWTAHNIDLIDQTLNTLHHTPLTPELRDEVIAAALAVKELVEANGSAFNNETKQQLFSQAWSEDGSSITNAKGEGYFNPQHTNLKQTIESKAADYDPENGESLVLQDLNFGNIAFANDRAYLVDPPYLRLGHPDNDRTVLGINILRQVQDEELRQRVRERFLTNPAVLASHIMYWVACTQQSPAVVDSEWGQFQQSCAKTALAEFEKLNLG